MVKGRILYKCNESRLATVRNTVEKVSLGFFFLSMENFDWSRIIKERELSKKNNIKK